jgi:hypothetical protein
MKTKKTLAMANFGKWVKSRPPGQWLIFALVLAFVIIGAVLLGIYIPRLSTVAPTATPTVTTPIPPITITITPTPTPPGPNQVSLATYNILNAAVCENANYSWHNRKKDLVNNLKSVMPDVFFCQEATQAVFPNNNNQSSIQYLLSQMPGYQMVPGLPRTPTGSMESVPMFWNATRVVNLSSVEAKYSQSGCAAVSPDEDVPRTYTYGQFQLIGTDIKFWAFGTHMPRKQCPDLQKADVIELQSVIESTVGDLDYFVLADWNNSGVFQANEYLANALGLNEPDNSGTKYDLNKDSCVFDSLVAGGALDRILSTQPTVEPIAVLPGSFNLNGIIFPTSDHAAVYGVFALL